MHFRVRKNVVQLVRMTYQAELKRGKSQIVGSVRLASLILSDELMASLTEEELSEFNHWVATKNHVDQLQEELAALTLAEQLQKAQTWFERQHNSEAASAIAGDLVAQWQSLRRVLAKNDLLD
jgi:hypothetical protein